jgi:hypothetical protein
VDDRIKAAICVAFPALAFSAPIYYLATMPGWWKLWAVPMVWVACVVLLTVWDASLEGVRRG